MGASEGKRVKVQCARGDCCEDTVEYLQMRGMKVFSNRELDNVTANGSLNKYHILSSKLVTLFWQHAKGVKNYRLPNEAQILVGTKDLSSTCLVNSHVKNRKLVG